MAPTRRASLFVGRADLVDRLNALLDNLVAGRGVTASISGDAGMGKTRLTLELEARALARGLVVLRGTCAPEDRSVPAAWVRDAVRRLAQAPGDAAPVLAEVAHELVDWVPDLRRFGGGDRYHATSELPAAHRLAHVLRRLASVRPVVVVAEDLHWSDASGVEAFLACSRVTSALPVLLVATHRTEEIGLELEEALAHLDRQRALEEMLLGPLTLAEVSSMIDALIAPATADAAVLDRIHALCEGNPFFVEEVTAQLVRPGGTRLDLRALEHVPVPRALRVVVRRGMQQLSDRARLAVEAASVIGHRFSVPRLATVAAMPVPQVVACLSEALAAGLVTELSADELAFRHALTREAVYEVVIGWERRRLHRVVAGELDRAEGDDPAMLAARSDHWYRAAVWDRALESALAAAARALELAAPGAAAELFDRAAEAAGRLGAELPLQLLRGRGKALELLGDFDRSRMDLEAAAELAAASADPVAMSEVRLDLGWLWSARDYARAGGYVRAALEDARAAEHPPTLARTLNRVGNWHLVSERPLEALELHEEALELFRGLGDERGAAQSLDLMGTVQLTLGEPRRASGSYLGALDRFRELGDRQAMASSLSMLTFCGPQYLNAPCGATGPGLAERLAWGTQALDLTRSIGWRSGQAVAMLGLASVLGYHGRYVEALAHAERATALADEVDHRYWQALGHLLTGAVHADTLAPERALESLETAYDLARRAGSDYWSRVATGFLVPALLGAGRTERAREVVASARAWTDELPTDARGMTVGQRHVWVACAELALREGAAERALAIATAVAGPPAGPPVAPSLALLDLRGRALEALGRDAEALATWQAGLAAARDGGVLPQAWRFGARLGRALRRAGRRAEAADRFGEAWSVLDRLAAGLPDDEATRFVGAARALVPTTTERERRKEQASGLTDREREVVAWVARGLTNAEIARGLSVSSRTVEKHVEHAMAKLGASSRVQLASWALRRDGADARDT